MNEIRHLVKREEDGKTVQHIALKVIKLSAGAFRSLKFSGGITLDGVPAHSTDRVKEGQEAVFAFQKAECVSLPAHPVDFSIPYEDEDFFVIDKPAPLPTMYSPKQGGATLETGLYHHLGCPRDYLFRPVNRLDKGTSGLMLVAKNAHAQQLMQKQLHSDLFIREYTALCEGMLRQDEGTISLPIGRMENSVKRFISPDGKEAVTHFRVLAKGKQHTLVRLRLETGRTHQIRVHLAHLGCPIAGDYLYGHESDRFSGRFALHSSRIAFYHPIKEKTIVIISNAPQMWYDMLEEEERE